MLDEEKLENVFLEGGRVEKYIEKLYFFKERKKSFFQQRNLKQIIRVI